MNDIKQTIPKATLNLKYISFYHALALLYGYKENYFYNLLKNKSQNIENIRSIVILHDLTADSHGNPTYEYDIEQLLEDETLKEQNKKYNKFDNLYSEFPQAAEQPDRKRIVTQNFLKWAIDCSYLNEVDVMANDDDKSDDKYLKEQLAKYKSDRSKGGKNSYQDYKPLKEKVQELCNLHLSQKEYPSALSLCGVVAKDIEENHQDLLARFQPYVTHTNDNSDWTKPTFYNWCNTCYKDFR